MEPSNASRSAEAVGNGTDGEVPVGRVVVELVGDAAMSVVVSVTSDEEASDVCESGYTVVVVTPEPTTVVEVGSGVGGRRLMPLESCAAAAERVLPARPTRSADGRISERVGGARRAS